MFNVAVYGSTMLELGIMKVLHTKKILMTHENISDDTDIIRKPMDIQTELIFSRDSVGEIRCSPLERSVYIHRPEKYKKMVHINNFRFIRQACCHCYFSLKSCMQREAGKPRWSTVIDLLLESDHFDVTR
ncbi:uncharacterized protein LOC112637083 isoform X1 [Camponotus floridanus]|uniref:uncharacterized protein LOC112637083 isoform X1 n=1 Tax=Camponotus floridanus TaxID=104421 RepID=UPI000DC6C4B3|nr:uncharacterized protein LOC112637083 isoform X1 [Camponotus floridanus]